MIKGNTILCFAGGYDALPTGKHYVMHILAVRNMVLWVVNYHESRVPTTSSSYLLHIANRFRQVVGGLKRSRKNLIKTVLVKET